MSEPRDAVPVAIIVLAVNGPDGINLCLEMLGRQSGLRTSIIVVGIEGSDPEPGLTGALEPSRFIAVGADMDFAAGCNRALAAAGDSDVVLLHAALEIQQTGWLARLRAAAYDQAQVGIVGCRTRRPDGILLHAGALITAAGETLNLGAGEKDVNQFNANREVACIAFGCVYIKRALIRQAGGFKRTPQGNIAERDYCVQARRWGYQTVCCGSITAVQLGNAAPAIVTAPAEKPPGTRRQPLRSLWGTTRPTSNHAPKVGWRSVARAAGGYANGSRHLMVALERQGVRVAYQYLFGPHEDATVPRTEAADQGLIRLMEERGLSSARAQVVFAQGDLLKLNTGAYKIGYSMLETDRIPAEWVRQANQMDEVWVPSRFNLEGFRQSGVTRPMRVVPLGIDPDYFNTGITSYHPSDQYVFLSVFEWGDRKAPEILFRAFNNEFRAAEPVVLICRTINRNPAINVAQEVRNLGLREEGGRIILSVNEVLPYHQTGSLYRSADCFVLPTRGEGWGMPILEAMACGLPVIATDWSGQREFMNDGNAYPLRVEGVVPAPPNKPIYAGLGWAEPSRDHLRQLMRWVFEHPVEGRAKGSIAAQEAGVRWTWDHAARLIAARLAEVGCP